MMYIALGDLFKLNVSDRGVYKIIFEISFNAGINPA